MSVRDWIWGWPAANRLLVLTVVSGSISVVCLFVIPVYVLEPMFQESAPANRFATRVICFVKLVLPAEWTQG